MSTTRIVRQPKRGWVSQNRVTASHWRRPLFVLGRPELAKGSAFYMALTRSGLLRIKS